jgi:hypothetical protein
MNRFQKIIDDTRKRAADAGLVDEAPAEAKAKVIQSPVVDDDTEFHHVRLPYSSDPKPIEEPWE